MKIEGLHIKPRLQVDMYGNVYGILGECRKALRQLGIDRAEIRRFTKDATSDDYDHLIDTVRDVFDVD